MRIGNRKSESDTCTPLAGEAKSRSRLRRDKLLPLVLENVERYSFLPNEALLVSDFWFPISKSGSGPKYYR